MTGGTFHGTTSDGTSVLLATVKAQPAAGTWTSIELSNSGPFTAVMYKSPDNGYGNVAEIELIGKVRTAGKK